MTFIFTAQLRTENKADDVRAEGKIPAVVYGPGTEPTSLTLEYNTFAALYDQAGESSLIDFSIEGQSGKPTKVLVQEIQYDNLKDRFMHVDFRQINMGVEMQATAELTFVGEAAAVKALGGTLNKQRETLDIKCLPKDLVSHIDVDLSKLATFEDSIHIKDLVFPAGVSPVDDDALLVAKVTAPLSEDQLAAMEETATVDVAAVEVDGEKTEEGAEGEASADKEGTEEKKAEAGGEEKK